MLKSSLKFNEAFEENVRKIYARVTINNESYDENDIFTIDFESGSVNGPGYQIGTVYSDLVKIKFDKVIREISELDKVIVELGIERESVETTKLPFYNSKVRHMRVGGGKLNKIFYDNPIEYSRLGVFYVSEHADINENDQTTTITCMDAILYFEQQYNPGVTFPANIYDVAVDISNQVGIPIDLQSFSFLPQKKITLSETISLRLLIGYLAQFACGFIKISKFGVLELKIPSITERIIDSSSYYQKGLSKNDLKYRIDGILNRNQTTSEELISGSATGSQLIIENPFIEQNDLDNIFESVKDIEYYPFTMQWFGIPSIEAGDWLIVKDNEGNQFKVPNLSYKLTYNGGLKATSSAETNSHSSELKIFENPLSREIKRINKEVTVNKKNAINVDSVIEKINISEEEFEGTTLQISGNKISINKNTTIEENSIEGTAIASFDAEKLVGSTNDDEFEINFEEKFINSRKTKKSQALLKNGDIVISNSSDIYQSVNVQEIKNIRQVDAELILQAINSTNVSIFDIDVSIDKLGILTSEKSIPDSLFTNREGETSQNQIIMSLLIAVQQLSKEIEILKNGGA